MLLGTLVHFVAFYLIFLNMPGDAPIAPVEGTNSSAYIRPRYTDSPFQRLIFLRVCQLHEITCQRVEGAESPQGSFAMVAFNLCPPGSSLDPSRSTEDENFILSFLAVSCSRVRGGHGRTRWQLSAEQLLSPSWFEGVG